MIKWTQEQIDDIINCYQKGNSKRALAKKYNCCSEAIGNVLKKHHVYIRNVHESNSKKLSEQVIYNIVNDYTISNMSIYQLQKKYVLSQDKITQTLKENGVQLRTYVEAKQLGRKYELNDNFFKNQNHNMAYILGLIAADGNVAKRENGIFIELHSQDEYLLEEINKITGNTRPLKHYIHKHPNGTETPATKFCAWSAEWKQDLAKYGIVPNKTFILQPPTFLNKEYYISFIKGYFDGDGSIWKRRNSDRYTISFVGASKPFIQWIRKILINQYGILTSNLNIDTTSIGTQIYRFTIEQKDSMYKLYYLWYDTEDTSTIYLVRKKEKFELYMKSRSKRL